MKCRSIFVITILALSPLMAAAQTPTCTNQAFVATATKVAVDKSSRTYTTMEVQDGPFNMRTNPYFHTNVGSDHLLADRYSQCVADVVTNLSRMFLYYGWQTIDGKIYTVANLVPRIGTHDSILNGPTSAANLNQKGSPPSDEATRSTPFLPPDVASSANQRSSRTRDFVEGQNARSEYDAWLNTIPEGGYKTGVLFWVAHRSDTDPPDCPYLSDDFESGCQDAQKHLASADVRGKQRPDFKLGWNSQILK